MENCSHWNKKLSFAKTFKHEIKTLFCNSCPCYCYKPYIHHFIIFYIVSDGRIYTKISKHFILVWDQLQYVNTFDLAWQSIFWRKWAISGSLLVLFTIFMIDSKNVSFVSGSCTGFSEFLWCQVVPHDLI